MIWRRNAGRQLNKRAYIIENVFEIENVHKHFWIPSSNAFHTTFDSFTIPSPNILNLVTSMICERNMLHWNFHLSIYLKIFVHVVEFLLFGCKMWWCERRLTTVLRLCGKRSAAAVTCFDVFMELRVCLTSNLNSNFVAYLVDYLPYTLQTKNWWW